MSNPLYPISSLNGRSSFDRFAPQRDKETFFLPAPATPHQETIYRVLFSREPQVQPKVEELPEIVSLSGTLSNNIAKPCLWNGKSVTLALRDQILLYDVTKKIKTWITPAPGHMVTAFSWNSDTDQLAIAYQNDLVVWDSNRDQSEVFHGDEESDPIQQIEWKTPFLVGLGSRRKFEVLDRRSGDPASYFINLDLEDYAGFQFVSENEVFCTTETGSGEIVDLRTQKKSLGRQKIATDRITHFETIQDKKRFATASLDGKIRVLQRANNRFKLISKIDTGAPILSMALINQVFVTSHAEGKICHWGASKGDRLEQFSIPSEIRSVVASPEQDRLAVSTRNDLLFYRA